jgi:hypothetical protein
MRVVRAVRASDSERDDAIRWLRGHFAAGRLDHDELEDRVERAGAARYRGELESLVSDLPRPGIAVRSAHVASRVDRVALRAHATAYGGLNGALVAAWALAGAGDFWPALTILPWGVLLAGHAWCSRAVRRFLSRTVDGSELPRRLAR